MKLCFSFDFIFYFSFYDIVFLLKSDKNDYKTVSEPTVDFPKNISDKMFIKSYGYISDMSIDEWKAGIEDTLHTIAYEKPLPAPHSLEC